MGSLESRPAICRPARAVWIRAARYADSEELSLRLKIRVSVVRFRPWPPPNSAGYASASPGNSGVMVVSDHLVTIAPRIASDGTQTGGRVDCCYSQVFHRNGRYRR